MHLDIDELRTLLNAIIDYSTRAPNPETNALRHKIEDEYWERKHNRPSSLSEANGKAFLDRRNTAAKEATLLGQDTLLTITPEDNNSAMRCVDTLLFLSQDARRQGAPKSLVLEIERPLKLMR